MPGTSDGVLLGPGALAKAITKPYDNVTLWQTGNFCTHDGKVYKFVGEDLVAGESWDPTHWSETKVTDELGILQAQIDALDPESGTGVFTDVAFTINTNQWTESSGTYSHNISNALIKATSGISVYWDSNYRNFNADVNVVKNTGYATITTTALPSNAVSGTLRIIDSVSGVLPTYRGGTGAVTAKGARQNLNVSIRDIPIDFGTVSSLPQTAYDADITEDMIPSHWEYTNPAACPNGLKCTTAAGSVTISLPTGGTFSGSTGVKIYLMNPRSAADGAGGQEQEQNAADYVQLSAQSLTAAQQTQVRTNINAASADTLGNPSSASAVTGSDAFSKINTLNNNLGMSTYLASSTLDELKSSLLTIAGTIPVNGRIGIQFSVNSSYISDIGLPEGGTYQGFLERISTYAQGYFSANLADNNGNTLLITYSNGTWKFNSLTSKITDFIAVPFTPADVGDSHIFARAYGRTVTINGYFVFTTAPTSDVAIGIITKYTPTDVVRTVCAFVEHAYDAPAGVGYVYVGTAGGVGVTPPSGNTKKTMYFSASWTYQGTW